MPTYEYRCNACRHQFETLQGIKEPALKKCPECGKNRLQRLIGAGAGFIFKGSGFYITDYRSSSYQEKAKAESNGASQPAGEAKGDSSSSSPKAESKPKPAASSRKGSGAKD